MSCDKSQPLWIRDPYTLVSWWNMRKFHGAAICALFANIGEIEGFTKGMSRQLRREPIATETKENLLKTKLVALYAMSLANGLKISAAYIERMRDTLRGGSVTPDDVASMLVQLRERIEDEMHAELFLYVPTADAPYYRDKQLFGPRVEKAFPSTVIDIEEAGKCYATGRHTACVLHLQRIMEVGLRTLGRSLGIDPEQNRSWDAILKKVDPELRKHWAEKEQFFKQNEQRIAEAAVLLRSVKITWRNPTMHVENIYDEEKALEVFNAVKGFMNYLAEFLAENEVQ